MSLDLPLAFKEVAYSLCKHLPSFQEIEARISFFELRLKPFKLREDSHLRRAIAKLS